jgi:WXG100 family type VII secretion target
MAHITQVNYEESGLISKGLHSEGDDIVQLSSQTRQRVHALHSEWVGDAADAFFEEMESELLPALQRVSGALFLGEEILNKVMKIIHEADEETAQFFKNDLGGDFGADLFGAAVGAALGGALGGGDDFGAGKFEEALSPEEGGQPSSGGEGTGEETVPMNTNPTMDMQPPTDETPVTETPPTETETPAGGGGGGGGGDSSQGLQGDLKGLGTGVGGVVQQTGAASGGPPSMPDHIFEGTSGGATGGATSQPGPGGGSGSQEQSSGGGIAGAAGAAGVLGAAAAGAAKVLKNDNNDQGE